MRLSALTLSLAVTATLGLVSCSTMNSLLPSHPSEPTPSEPRNSAANTIRPAESNGLENVLDKYDQEKMSHALDKPLGKTTDWSNPRTGTSYTVTPISKLTYNGNPYCRKYTLIANRHGSQHQSSGTACVSATDSSWQIVH